MDSSHKARSRRGAGRGAEVKVKAAEAKGRAPRSNEEPQRHREGRRGQSKQGYSKLTLHSVVQPFTVPLLRLITEIELTFLL